MRISKAFLYLAALVFVASAAYCNAAEVTVELSANKTQIHSGEPIAGTVKVTNTGAADLIIPRPDRAGFGSLLSIDNSNLGFSGGIGIVSMSGESPTIVLHPHESAATPVSISGRSVGKPAITFRMGFKPDIKGNIAWSNPVTVTFLKDEESPVKVEAILVKNSVSITNIDQPENIKAHVKFTNTGTEAQDIGMDNICGVPELNSLISDNASIQVMSAGAACLSNPYASREVVLKFGESYEQDCRVTYSGEDAQPGPVTFRIGVKSIGHAPAFSNPLNLSITGGTPQWTKHRHYMNSLMAEYKATPPENGVVKRYHENGALRKETTYKNGKQNGPYKTYYDSGKLWQEVMYTDGKQNGLNKEYSKDGALWREEFFSNNQLVWYKTYNPDGSLDGYGHYMRMENGNYAPIRICAEKNSSISYAATLPICKPEDIKDIP